MELIGIFALEGRIKGRVGGHVGVDVTGRLKNGPESADLFVVTHARDYDGHLGTHRNVIKTRFMKIPYAMISLCV